MRSLMQVYRDPAQMNKRGQIAGLTGNILQFAIVVIILAVVGIILANLQATQTTDSVGYNITGDGLTGVTNISNQLGLMGLIIVMGAILVIVLGIFAFNKLGG